MHEDALTIRFVCLRLFHLFFGILLLFGIIFYLRVLLFHVFCVQSSDLDICCYHLSLL